MMCGRTLTCLLIVIGLLTAPGASYAAKHAAHPAKAKAPVVVNDSDDDDDDDDDSAASSAAKPVVEPPPADTSDGWDDDPWAESDDEVDPSVPKENVYTLDRCLSLALAQNRFVKAAHWKVEYGKARALEAQWAWFPRITVQTLIAPAPDINSPAETDPDFLTYHGPHWYQFDGVVWGNEVAMTAPLFTFGKIYNTMQLGPLAEKAAKLEEEKVKVRVAYEVKRAYYTLQLMEETLDTLADGLDYIQQAQDKLEELLAKNDETVSIVDRYKFEVQRTEVLSRQEDAKEGHELMLRALRALLGLAPDAPFYLEHRYLRKPEPQPAFANADDFVSMMLDKRPESRQLVLDETYKERELKRQWSNFFPDIALALKYKYITAPEIRDIHNPWLNDPYHSNSVTGYLGLQYVLDLPSDIAHYRQAKAQLEESREMRKAASMQFSMEAQEAVLRYQKALTQVEINRTGSHAGRKWMVSRSMDYNMGLIESSDMADSISAYFKTQFNYLNSLSDARQAEAKLEQLLGQMEKGQP